MSTVLHKHRAFHCGCTLEAFEELYKIQVCGRCPQRSDWRGLGEACVLGFFKFQPINCIAWPRLYLAPLQFSTTIFHLPEVEARSGSAFGSRPLWLLILALDFQIRWYRGCGPEETVSFQGSPRGLAKKRTLTESCHMHRTCDSRLMFTYYVIPTWFIFIFKMKVATTLFSFNFIRWIFSLSEVFFSLLQTCLWCLRAHILMQVFHEERNSERWWVNPRLWPQNNWLFTTSFGLVGNG